MKAFLGKHNQARLSAYRECPQDLTEHHGIEQTVLAGGYGYRQILELVQNGADAILEASKAADDLNFAGRIDVLVHGESLYVGNTGTALSEDGLRSLLSSHSSPKRGNEIGRFGLGFKSLLRLGGTIDLIIRTSGGVRFNPERCRSELKQTFNVEDAPALRLAWPFEDLQDAGDPILARFTWAETVVRARVADPAFVDHLREEIRGFPAEFLLFLQAAVEIHLDDGAGWHRSLAMRPEDGEFVLTSGDSASRWLLACCDVPVDNPIARADATHIHARDSVPLAWAIPVDSRREEAGRFWAFFPTHTPTYLPGILNAPWKLNSDRNAVIPGEWNDFLMRATAGLVARTIPSLASLEDPGRVLDAFPRQMPRADEDAAPLVEALWAELAQSAVVPDGTGAPKPAYRLHRPPTNNTEVARRWEGIADADARGQVVHSSCLLKQRLSRLDGLAEHLPDDEEESSDRPNLTTMPAVSWFRLVASPKIQAATEVLRLAEAYAGAVNRVEWNRLRGTLPIVPVEDGDVVTACEAVFAAADVHVPGRRAVDTSLAADVETRRILEEVLGVKPIADDVWVAVLAEHFPLEGADKIHCDEVWKKRWAVLRSAPEAVRAAFLRGNGSRVRVRRRDETWVTAKGALLPGTLVAEDDRSANCDVLVDLEFHRCDKNILDLIGVTDLPGGVAKASAHDFPEWLGACRSYYRSQHQNRASWSYLQPDELKMPSGRKFLTKLIGTPHAKLTSLLVGRITEPVFAKLVRFGHCSVASYPEIDVSHPLPWFLLAYGSVLIGLRSVRLTAIHERHADPALNEIETYSNLAKALETQVPQVPIPAAAPEDIITLWHALIAERVTPATLANDSLRDLWVGAAQDDVVPGTLPSVRGNVPLAEVFVTSVPDLARRLGREDRVVVALDEKTLQVWIDHGARELSVKPEWSAERSGGALLVSVIPEIGDVLTAKAKESARCRSVTSLGLGVEGASEPVPCLFWRDELVLDVAQLQSLSRAERLGALLHALAGSGWLDRPAEEALAHLADSQLDERRAAVARGADLSERLLLAVGGRKEALLNGLGDLGNLEWIRERGSVELARLTLAHFGPATLTILSTVLDEEGLQSPSRWGTAEARAFVAAIGFPVEFASSPAARREPEETITGPIDLSDLHDFQEEVFAGIKNLLAGGEPRRRAVVSLPTGGGKTRVAVEAAVCLVLKPGSDRRSVLWIAQTDELCEQAVQAFRQVWLNKGAKRTDLRIVRLWGSNPNPAPPADGKPVAVVASIQTLNNRMGLADLAWLEHPGLVVIDECHHAIAPSYTGLLGWLNAAYRPPGAEAVDEPPILGLSATPFRMDDEESARLAKRFDQRWFPDKQAELHARLLTQGVLARVEYEELHSEAALTSQELDALSRFESLEGIEVDRFLAAFNQRLAGDSVRNERIVDRLRNAPERSILLFANSVDHSAELSARLNLCGIPAAAISGETPRTARRWFLDRFQRSEICVLCNHSVLTTGFDAPKTDLILISRQVFSPVRYMQMVGRGLRGPRNGGTPTCRIVSVLDNFGRFQDRHPYHYCRRYFESLGNQTADLEAVGNSITAS